MLKFSSCHTRWVSWKSWVAATDNLLSHMAPFTESTSDSLLVVGWQDWSSPIPSIICYSMNHFFLSRHSRHDDVPAWSASFYPGAFSSSPLRPIEAANLHLDGACGEGSCCDFCWEASSFLSFPSTFDTVSKMFFLLCSFLFIGWDPWFPGNC